MCSIPCKGYCCRRFFLPFSPQELENMVADGNFRQYDRKELEQVAGMVIFLGADNLDANKEPNQSGRINNWYTCKNLNRKTGDCMDYLNRPRMCSDFPYDKPCEYHKCSSHPWWRHYKVTRWIHSLLPKKRPAGVMKKLDLIKETIKAAEEDLVHLKAPVVE